MKNLNEMILENILNEPSNHTLNSIVTESVLDDDDVILSKIDKMFDFDIWKAKSNLNKYKKIIENIYSAVSHYPCKDNVKKFDVIHNNDLTPGVYYIQFHNNTIGPCFSIFKKDSDHLGCRFMYYNNRKTTVIRWSGLNDAYVKSCAYPAESIFKIPKELNDWVEELKKHAQNNKRNS